MIRELKRYWQRTVFLTFLAFINVSCEKEDIYVNIESDDFVGAWSAIIINDKQIDCEQLNYLFKSDGTCYVSFGSQSDESFIGKWSYSEHDGEKNLNIDGMGENKSFEMKILWFSHSSHRFKAKFVDNGDEIIFLKTLL